MIFNNQISFFDFSTKQVNSFIILIQYIFDKAFKQRFDSLSSQQKQSIMSESTQEEQKQEHQQLQQKIAENFTKNITENTADNITKKIIVNINNLIKTSLLFTISHSAVTQICREHFHPDSALNFAFQFIFQHAS